MELSFRQKPFDHQLVGIDALTKLSDPERGRIFPGCFALFDEMGAGKTKQVIDAAQILHLNQEIDRVIVVCPATVIPVWTDPELGELVKHLWQTVPNIVTEFRPKISQWKFGPDSKTPLKWIVTNYDYIRDKDRLAFLRQFCSKRTMLILDESSAVKGRRTNQTKSCMSLRKKCGRVVLLNGTPISHSPTDMFSQGRLMDPRILDCATWYEFRARYAVLGGFMKKQIVEWKNLEDLQARFKPYVLRRLKIDCLDLPEKLPSVTISVPLSERTWAIYQSMRDDMIAWLSQESVVTAPQAISRVMRLSQLTSGFIGGVEQAFEEPEELDEEQNEERPDWLPGLEPSHRSMPPQPIQVVGEEKLKTIIAWLSERLEEDDQFKVLMWCRFRPELARLVEAISTTFPQIRMGEIRGGQKKEERNQALRLLDPRTTPAAPIVVLGTPKTGSMGLNLTATHTVMYVSNGYSLKERLQADDRVHRPGQTCAVSYFDVVATGPRGQRTIDHTIIRSLRSKHDLASWTAAAWIQALKE